MNTKYNIGQIIRRDDTITGITIGKTGEPTYSAKSGISYTEADLEKLVVLPADEPPYCAPQPSEDKPAHEFKVGDKVRYIGLRHEESPRWYPKPGTTGVISEADSLYTAWVQWESGSTAKEGRWNVCLDDIEPYTEPEKPKEPEYLNMRVVCVDNGGICQHWTIGRVYEFKNGYAITDNGTKSPMDSGLDDSPIKTFEALGERYCSGIKFIEFKGEQEG